MSNNTILAINPGSTSTKIAVFEGKTPKFEVNIHHANEQLAQFAEITDQFDFRKNEILTALDKAGIKLKDLDIIVGRGGLTYPLESGVYLVNDAMKHDLKNSPLGTHASNLGGLIADNLAAEIGGGVKACIADPVVVDEMDEIAKITGTPLIRRKSIFHALNQKAVARRYAKEQGKSYDQMNFVVAHLGGGISVGAHKMGRVVDVNNALDGEGPFTPERAGTLPAGDLVSLIFKHGMSESKVRKLIKGEGGLVALLGSNNAKDVEDKAMAGDAECQKILTAMSYNIAKNIGAMAAVLEGKVDAVIITGGIAYSKPMMKEIEQMVKFIAPVVVIPGEDEMSALAMNGLMVLEGEIKPREYTGKAK